ncbi:MAG: 4-hydroxy-tetrahydrodipicolinate reductase [Fibrobacteria bacterium]|nr:4-hydroxy-tetrahydrodipicolinate reductase [Fibrobacteria bacterium]
MSSDKTKVIVAGVMGRMGQMILSACNNNPQVEVIGVTEAPGTPFIGKTVQVAEKSLEIVDSLSTILEENAVIIDFTAPKAVIASLPKVIQAKAKLVIGATGFSEPEKAEIKTASSEISIVLSPNMSVGVNVLLKVCELLGSTLKEEYDAEVIEIHHKHKKDAPSGTALGLAEALAKGRQVNLDEKAIYGRKGLIGERPHGEIGMHAVRGGDVVGDHTVLFAGDFERIEVKHVAHSRATFANGSVKAALFLQSKSNGFFTMQDVLGLS